MYLKSLTLKGFKSFADRSVLSLEPGVTAIVGPNGSGKSNISDAVLWVLGERNAKNLRGQVMEDVIFAGSSARKSVGVAEVELVLDNSDGALPVDYSEVSIGRRMYRNGESEYLINGAIARRMDVLDILHDSGLGTGTYSIISQGNLDSILQSKPEDRRALIEEAAGTLKHKQRKAKSQHRIELMEQSAARIQDVVSEIERQLGPLERKAKRAVTYKDLSKQLNDYSLQLAVDDVRELRNKWNALTQSEHDIQEKLEQQKQRIDECEQHSARYQQQLRSGSESVTELARKHSLVSGVADRFDAQASLFEEKLRQAKLRSAELIAAQEDAQQRKSVLQAEIADLSAQLEELTVQVSAEKARVEEAEHKHLDASRILSGLERDVFDKQHQRKDAENEEQQVRVSHAKASEQLATAQNRAEVWQERVASAEEHVKQAQESVDAAQQSCTAKREELQTLQENYDATLAATQTCKREQKEADDAKQVLEESSRSLKARILALEELERQSLASQSPAAAWVGTQDRFDLHAIVHQFSVSPEYEELVELLLGQDISLLSVDNARVLESLRSALQQNDVEGFISLLLAGNSKARAACISAEDARVLGGQLLIDYITYPQELAHFIEARFGNVVLFERFEDALRAFDAMNTPCTLLTRAGEMIDASGKITLGKKCASNYDGSLRRARELESLHEQQHNNARELAAQQERCVNAAEKLAAAQEAELAASQELAHAKGNLSALEKELAQARTRLVNAEREMNDVSARNAEIMRSIENTQPRVAQLAEQLEACIQRTIDAKAALSEAQKAVAPARETESTCARSLADIKLSFAMLSERNVYLERVLQARNEELQNLDASELANTQSQKTQQLISNRALPLIQTIRLLSDAARAKARLLEQASIEAQTNSTELHTRAQEAIGLVHAAREQYDAITSQLSELRIEKGRLEVQVESAVSVLTNDFELSLERALALPELHNRNEIEETVANLKRRIANMGSINPDAAQEYESLKLRYDFLVGQLNDLSTARAALRKIDAIIDSRMKESFVTTFNRANENFKEIFATLFPGGTGELVLDNPADLETSGIEVIAQPRGKKITKMTLMSGGEKSLVALALLFAVYRVRTTPFYILDEVEAALDDSNLRRLIAYLQELRGTTQLIMITHQRRTMEMSDVLFGVSMQADGVTKVMSQRLEHALSYAE